MRPWNATRAIPDTSSRSGETATDSAEESNEKWFLFCRNTLHFSGGTGHSHSVYDLWDRDSTEHRGYKRSPADPGVRLGFPEKHVTPTNLDYTVLDLDGTVLYRTRSGLSESIFSAVNHRDTILNIQAEDAIAGQVLIHSGEEEFLHNRKKAAVFAFAAAALLQLVLCGTYFLHIQRTVVKPFQKLKCFAERIADGCLDIPLEMDRKNLFGAFTESFDLMRSELKKAKLEAAGADAAKKELVAKLSHDIKTPVASIKAAAEVAAALAADEKTKYTYEQIIQKTDQINTLV